MRQLINKNYRDVGYAFDRYSSNEKAEFRDSVAKHIKSIADGYLSIRHLNFRPFLKRAAMLYRQAERYAGCGNEYVVVACGGCGNVLTGPKRCESRICEDCAKKYASRVRHRQLELAKALPNSGKRRLMFLTLTKKTRPGFSPQASDVKLIFNDARKLINRFWPGKQRCGAFAVIEIGSNQNIHIHALVYGFYIPQSRISSHWLKITGDSFVVHIEQVRQAKRYIGYLLKYITKPPHSKDPKELAKFIDLMMGVRRIRTYGIFYNCGLLHKESCPCPFCGGKFYYCRLDDGKMIPEHALFFKEMMQIVKENQN
ncbi:MAG: hypothetical protein KAR42_05830 [candidate division Zixibacteria bacterium]|nr:hypothetical protein [candidate division Zixibacteria bacterium]